MTTVVFGEWESMGGGLFVADSRYYVLEGVRLRFAGEDSRCRQTGDCLAGPSHTPHAVVAPDGCKLLQITLS